MLRELLLARPEQPLKFLRELLNRPDEDGKYNHNRLLGVDRCVSLMCLVTVPQVVVYGPPSSGQHSVVNGDGVL